MWNNFFLQELKKLCFVIFQNFVTFLQLLGLLPFRVKLSLSLFMINRYVKVRFVFFRVFKTKHFWGLSKNQNSKLNWKFLVMIFPLSWSHCNIFFTFDAAKRLGNCISLLSFFLSFFLCTVHICLMGLKFFIMSAWC